MGKTPRVETSRPLTGAPERWRSYPRGGRGWSGHERHRCGPDFHGVPSERKRSPRLGWC